MRIFRMKKELELKLHTKVMVKNQKDKSMRLGTVSMTSTVDKHDVIVSVDGKDELVSKDNITLVEDKKHYELMYLNKKVHVNTDDGLKIGNVTKFSGIYEAMVTIKLTDGSIITANKAAVTEYVVPKEYFKNYQKPTKSEKEMAELFTKTTHKSVVETALDGIDMSQFDIIEDSEYYAAIPKDTPKGTKLPVFIAHTDLHPNLTHPTPSNLEYDGNIFRSNTGLGADDRAGVFAIRKMLETHSGEFMLLFPDKEEVGLVGSKKFAKSKGFSKMDDLASMFISIDRRRETSGDKSLATYGCNNEALNKWVSTLTSRKVLKGSSTDCRALSIGSKHDVPCFNLSCGYTGEHTRQETLRFDELQETIKDLKLILEDARVNDTFKFVSPYIPVRKTTSYRKPSQSGFEYILDDTIEVDGDWFFEDDVKDLLAIYNFYTGDVFSSSGKNYIIPEIQPSDQVRLDPGMIVGQTYGGQLFTEDMRLGMESNIWEVDSIDKFGTMELSEAGDSIATCTNIPRRWVVLVGDESPSIIL
ncbi:MAG: hypothetical protein U9R21_08020 [Candidatus Thermoplasmatota archaeon]|nr:hypothetical protein [Candidatus Thermoplasmatota archaeon]